MHNLFGRERIYCDSPVTVDSLIDVLREALDVHRTNEAAIEYLYQYYKGKQPILLREKLDYMAVCNKIVINRANEIVSFKDGYLIGEPTQYIGRGESDDKNEEINELNSYMELADKPAQDMDLVNWMHICGQGYRMVLPSTAEPDVPFTLHTLDPRNTFVVYLNSAAKEPQMAVTYVVHTGTLASGGINKIVYTCYLKNRCVTVETDGLTTISFDNARIVSDVAYSAPTLPIVEFPANKERLGVFETVITLLDAINLAESNRLDGVEQFVQSILCFIGTDIEETDLKKLLHMRTIAIPSTHDGRNIDVKYLVQELNQTETQVLLDDMYDTVLDICGVPSRSGGASTSDTGAAVIMREGWSSAEGRAKVTELMFKRADREVLRNVLNILRVNTDLDLSVRDIETKFSRHNYEGLTVKSNALISMLNCGKIHPLDAFQQSNLFIDSEAAFRRGMEHYEQNKEVVPDGFATLQNADGDPTDPGQGE